MSLVAGEKLGPYEILSLIGKGGMGEVYRARDPRLNRDVAIKVSAVQFSERFDREARAVAALNHPNICQVYDVGPNYLVMEYIEGEAPAGPMPLDAAIHCARQIADALEAAHEKGIVHRDLKPANIKIKADGTVKVLDFGLAKLTVESDSAVSENSPTLSIAATQAGMILGTAGYMSPEQARGKTVDKRADIWAFGVVFYEMLTGERLFQGEDVSHTMAAVIMQQPNLDVVPVKVRSLLQSCLEKDPKKRLRDIGDVWRLLEDGAAPPMSPQLRHQKIHWLWPSVAALLLVVLAGLSFFHLRETAPAMPVLRTTILPPPNTDFDFSQGAGLFALSPDGKKIVFGARTPDGKEQLWVRPLDGLTAQALAGTEGALFPFWSPDSQQIAFFADGHLKKINAGGGAVITLTDVALGRGGSWNQDGVIIFGTNPVSEIHRVSEAGGTATVVSKETGRFPSFLPDGKHYLYQVERGNEASVMVGSLDGLASKELKTLGKVTSNAIYAQGRLLYQRDGTLMAQPFDATRLETTGEAIPIAEQVGRVLNSGTVGSFTVSQSDLLAFRAGSDQASRGLQLTWIDRQGKVLSVVGDQGRYAGLVLSHDGTKVAFERDSGESSNRDIFLHEFSSGITTRFTTNPVPDVDPVWSPDGSSIAFVSQRDKKVSIYRKASNGAGAEELLLQLEQLVVLWDWSRDGRFLLFTIVGEKDGGNLSYLPTTNPASGSPSAPAKAIPYLNSEFVERDAHFSPDGRFVAYSSNKSGPLEIYVRPFPDANGNEWKISQGGGIEPRWRGDGKELYYIAPPPGTRSRPASGQGLPLMAVEIAAGASGTFKAVASRKLFDFPQGPNVYDVTSDGQKFLRETLPEAVQTTNSASTAPTSPPITLIFNWIPASKK